MIRLLHDSMIDSSSVLIMSLADVLREVLDGHSAHGTLHPHRTFLIVAAVAEAVAPVSTTATLTTTSTATTAAASVTSAAVTSSTMASTVSSVSWLWHILLTERFPANHSRSVATWTLQVLPFTRADLQRHTVLPWLR